MRAILALAALALSACVVYEPAPVAPAGPSTFDRAWSAAVGATKDAGIQVQSADPSTGLIRGTKDGIDVTAAVARQPNGGVRVQFDAKGPTQRDPNLSNRFSEAYERRMGR